MKNNILSENDLSDNERKKVYYITFNDHLKLKKKIVIYAKNIDEASRIFHKHEGPKADMLHVVSFTESEWKEYT